MSIEQCEFELSQGSGNQPEPVNRVAGAVTPPEPVAAEPDQPATVPLEGVNWHAEAGRKGARRVHQLIQAGRLYEQEHGLKPGRQRLRQLIAQGRLYEQEHGLSNGHRAGGRRPAKLSHRQSLKLFLQLLVRVTKPGFREQLLKVLQDLESPPAELKEGA